MSRRSIAQRCLVLAALALGCGPAGRSSPGEQGKVKLGFNAKARSGASQTTTPICATYTLQPYSLDAGGISTMAGSPVVIDSASASSSVAAIVGCIDSLPNTGSPPADDWGYLVTASGFNDCQGNPLAVTPTVVTQNHPFNCVAGLDRPLSIETSVSIPQPNSAGYIDISATVGVTPVEVGCKQADLGAGGKVHFGETTSYPGARAPLGFTALGGVDGSGKDLALAASSVLQYDGILARAGQPSVVYYTGQTAPPQGGDHLDILQGIAQKCPAGQFYAATQTPECDTTVSLGMTGPVLDTKAYLADAFVVVPGGVWASASIDLAGHQVIITSGGNTLLSDANPPASTSWNHSAPIKQGVPIPGQLVGLFVNLVTPGAFWAVYNPASPIYAPITFDQVMADWALGAGVPVSSITNAQMQTLGLFQQVSTNCLPMPAAVHVGVAIDYSTALAAAASASGIAYANLCGKASVMMAKPARGTNYAIDYQRADLLVRGSDPVLRLEREIQPVESLYLNAALTSAYLCGDESLAAIRLDHIDTVAEGYAGLELHQTKLDLALATKAMYVQKDGKAVAGFAAGPATMDAPTCGREVLTPTAMDAKEVAAFRIGAGSLTARAKADPEFIPGPDLSILGYREVEGAAPQALDTLTKTPLGTMDGQLYAGTVERLADQRVATGAAFVVGEQALYQDYTTAASSKEGCDLGASGGDLAQAAFGAKIATDFSSSTGDKLGGGDAFWASLDRSDESMQRLQYSYRALPAAVKGVVTAGGSSGTAVNAYGPSTSSSMLAFASKAAQTYPYDLEALVAPGARLLGACSFANSPRYQVTGPWVVAAVRTPARAREGALPGLTSVAFSYSKGDAVVYSGRDVGFGSDYVTCPVTQSLSARLEKGP